MALTREDLDRITNQAGYSISGNDSRARRSPELEQAAWVGTLGEAETKGGVQERFLVRVVAYRRRLLDEDNLSCKAHVDFLRYAGIIPDDKPPQVSIQTSQVKIKAPEESRIELTVIKL